eukprot:1153941-Pelagomonas_calceolata.AAC.1
MESLRQNPSTGLHCSASTRVQQQDYIKVHKGIEAHHLSASSEVQCTQTESINRAALQCINKSAATGVH